MFDGHATLIIMRIITIPVVYDNYYYTVDIYIYIYMINTSSRQVFVSIPGPYDENYNRTRSERERESERESSRNPRCLSNNNNIKGGTLLVGRPLLQVGKSGI